MSEASHSFQEILASSGSADAVAERMIDSGAYPNPGDDIPTPEGVDPTREMDLPPPTSQDANVKDWEATRLYMAAKFAMYRQGGAATCTWAQL